MLGSCSSWRPTSRFFPHSSSVFHRPGFAGEDHRKKDGEGEQRVFLLRYPRAVLALTAVITIGLGSQIEEVHFNFDVKEFLPEGTPARTGYDRLTQTEAFPPDFAVMRASSVREAVAGIRTLMERPDLIARVQSVGSFLPDPSPERERALEKLVAAAGGAWSNGPH